VHYLKIFKCVKRFNRFRKIGNKSEVFDVSFDIRKATIDQMIFMYENVFKKISVSETKASEIILKDENGRPIMGDDNKIQKNL